MRKDTIQFQEKGEIKMIAHRGLSGLERENTNAAFVAAGQRGYYGIETDVHITADGKFIIIHDDDLKRIAKMNRRVEDMTFDELRAVRLTDLDGVERGDLCLPSLDEYLRICKKYDKQAILELKNEMPKAKIWEIVEVVKKFGWFENTTFISFHYENLLAVREKYPIADVQFLTDKVKEKLLERMIADKIDADFAENCISKELVERLHTSRRKVNVWTVDEIKAAKKLKEMGVDFITTNILE